MHVSSCDVFKDAQHFLSFDYRASDNNVNSLKEIYETRCSMKWRSNGVSRRLLQIVWFKEVNPN